MDSTTVNVGSDISSYLDSITKPVHEGYEFSEYSISAGSISNVTEDATVTLVYSESGGEDEPKAYVFVNGDNNLVVNISEIKTQLTGEQTVSFKLNKAIDVDYDSITVEELEVPEGEEGIKVNTQLNGLVISCTDANIGTHGFYEITFKKNDAEVNMTESFNNGLRVETVTIGSGNTAETYDAIEAGQ